MYRKLLVPRSKGLAHQLQCAAQRQYTPSWFWVLHTKRYIMKTAGNLQQWLKVEQWPWNSQAPEESHAHVDVRLIQNPLRALLFLNGSRLRTKAQQPAVGLIGWCGGHSAALASCWPSICSQRWPCSGALPSVQARWHLLQQKLPNSGTVTEKM